MYDPTVQQSPGYPPTLAIAPRRRRGRVIAFVAGLVLLACCVGGVTAQLVGQALREAAGGPGQPAPTMGDAVHDGQFEFVVSGMTCGLPEIVNGILRARAQGQFCVVAMTVTNTGDEPRHFADGNQRAYGPGDQLYAADTNAGVVANGSGAAVWNVINPGNWVEAKVVFDIPPIATIATVELHDSPLSGGVRVTVSASARSATSGSSP